MSFLRLNNINALHANSTCYLGFIQAPVDMRSALSDVLFLPFSPSTSPVQEKPSEYVFFLSSHLFVSSFIYQTNICRRSSICQTHVYKCGTTDTSSTNRGETKLRPGVSNIPREKADEIVGCPKLENLGDGKKVESGTFMSRKDVSFERMSQLDGRRKLGRSRNQSQGVGQVGPT